MEPGQTELERHQRIQLAAYSLWQQRGGPFGTPDVDWFRAEEQLREESEEAAPKPALVAVAEGVGSALGSVAGLVASIKI
jgi:Protein of unknown function (DUF2934)